MSLVLLSLSLASLFAPVPVDAAAQAAAAPRVVQIIVGDNMKFDPATVAAKPGERLKIVLKDIGTMPKMAMGHNFVLLVKGANAKEVADKCASARATEFIAAEVKPKLIAFTKLVGPGETADVVFAAPKQPGDYVFICSFPGHFAAGMKGILTVK
jgi:azurin